MKADGGNDSPEEKKKKVSNLLAIVQVPSRLGLVDLSIELLSLVLSPNVVSILPLSILHSQ